MTDFNGINRDKNLGANFNTARHGKNGKADGHGSQGDAAPSGDPYANQKMDPNSMLDLLATQGKQSLQGANVANPAIERSITSFTSQVSPDRHAQVSRMMAQTYASEFGAPPSQGLLQDLVDNFLIGGVSIQSA